MEKVSRHGDTSLSKYIESEVQEAINKAYERSDILKTSNEIEYYVVAHYA